MLQNEMLGASVINVDVFRLIEGVQLLQMYNVAYYTGRNTERTILYVQDLQLHVNGFGRDAELTPYVQARRLGRRVILERTPNWDSERVMMLYLTRKGLNIFDERQLAKVCRKFGIPPKLECSLKLTKEQRGKKILVTEVEDGPALTTKLSTFTSTSHAVPLQGAPERMYGNSLQEARMSSNELQEALERVERINAIATDDD